jgi:hypothetical protein
MPVPGKIADPGEVIMVFLLSGKFAAIIVSKGEPDGHFPKMP